MERTVKELKDKLKFLDELPDDMIVVMKSDNTMEMRGVVESTLPYFKVEERLPTKKKCTDAFDYTSYTVTDYKTTTYMTIEEKEENVDMIIKVLYIS